MWEYLLARSDKVAQLISGSVTLAAVLFGAAMIGSILFFIDADLERHPKKKTIGVVIAVVCAFGLVVFGVLGEFCPTKQEVGGWLRDKVVAEKAIKPEATKGELEK